MTYYDRLNEFFKVNEEKPLPASVQLVMLHLLHENNRLKNTGNFTCTDARLQQLTNLAKDTITQAKRHLKNVGLINFKTDNKNPRAGTLYILPNAERNAITDTPLSVNSEEVIKTWRECAGENLRGGTAMGMIELENAYGTQAVVDAIITADKANSENRLTFNFVKAVLKNKLKGATSNGNRRNNGRSEYSIDEYSLVDEYPER